MSFYSRGSWGRAISNFIHECSYLGKAMINPTQAPLPQLFIFNNFIFIILRWFIFNRKILRVEFIPSLTNIEVNWKLTRNAFTWLFLSLKMTVDYPQTIQEAQFLLPEFSETEQQVNQGGPAEKAFCKYQQRVKLPFQKHLPQLTLGRNSLLVVKTWSRG